jgi:hypothetical protein
MIHEIHVAEEPTVLASPHKAEIRMIATVGEDESSTGREVARARNDVGFYGRWPDHQRCHQESSCQERGCQSSECIFTFSH